MSKGMSFLAALLTAHSGLFAAENPSEEPQSVAKEFRYTLTVEAEYFDELPVGIFGQREPSVTAAGVLPAGTKFNVISKNGEFLHVQTDVGRAGYISGKEFIRTAEEAFDEVPEVFQIASSSNDFAFDLYRKLRESESQLIFSPLNVSSALAMVYAGANGETKRQIESVLHLGELPDGIAEDRIHAGFGGLAATLKTKGPGYQLQSANRLFVQPGSSLRPQFLIVTRKNYGAEASRLDFGRTDEARRQINEWASTETKGKIPELVPTGVLNQDTRVVVTAAVHLTANWRKPFPKAETKSEAFRNSDGREVRVPMMHLKRARLSFAERDGLKLLQLPYSDGDGGDLSMLLFLPDSPAGWLSLDRQLSSKFIYSWKKQLEVHIVDVSLPRFRFESPARLAKPLADLGMPLAFDPHQADFSGVTSERLFLREVLHAASIAVDESGTEAAAANGAVMELVSRPPPAVFKADRPFLFLIRDDRTNAILFVGRVENPMVKRVTDLRAVGASRITRMPPPATLDGAEVLFWTWPSDKPFFVMTDTQGQNGEGVQWQPFSSAGHP